MKNFFVVRYVSFIIVEGGQQIIEIEISLQETAFQIIQIIQIAKIRRRVGRLIQCPKDFVYNRFVNLVTSADTNNFYFRNAVENKRIIRAGKADFIKA